MTIRAILFLPMFGALWYFLEFNPVWGLLCLSMGVIMYLTGVLFDEKVAPLIYEFVYGGVIGGALWLVIAT